MNYPKSNPDIEEEKESHRPSFGKSILKIINALRHKIPVELALTIDPDIQKTLLDEYHREAKDRTEIKDKIGVMLKLIEKYFPKLEKGSPQWRGVRAHFFTSIGLWGGAN